MDNKEISKLGDKWFNKPYDRMAFKYLCIFFLGLIGIALMAIGFEKISYFFSEFMLGGLSALLLIYWTVMFTFEANKLRLKRNIYMLNLAREDEKEKV